MRTTGVNCHLISYFPQNLPNLLHQQYLLLFRRLFCFLYESGIESISKEKSNIANIVNVLAMPAIGIRNGAIKKAPIPAPTRSNAYTHAPGLPFFQWEVRKPKRGKAAPQRIPSISIKRINTKVTTAFDVRPVSCKKNLRT
jgi:hypothetical protein